MPVKAQRPERCVSTNFTISACFAAPQQSVVDIAIVLYLLHLVNSRQPPKNLDFPYPIGYTQISNLIATVAQLQFKSYT